MTESIEPTQTLRGNISGESASGLAQLIRYQRSNLPHDLRGIVCSAVGVGQGEPMRNLRDSILL